MLFQNILIIPLHLHYFSLHSGYSFTPCTTPLHPDFFITTCTILQYLKKQLFHYTLHYGITSRPLQNTTPLIFHYANTLAHHILTFPLHRKYSMTPRTISLHQAALYVPTCACQPPPLLNLLVCMCL